MPPKKTIAKKSPVSKTVTKDASGCSANYADCDGTLPLADTVVDTVVDTTTVAKPVKTIVKKRVVKKAVEKKKSTEVVRSPVSSPDAVDVVVEKSLPPYVIPNVQPIPVQTTPTPINSGPRPKQTIPVLSRFEKAALISQRSAQIASGSPLTFKNDVLKLTHPIDIAREEFRLKTIPLLVIRVLPDGTEEKWNVREFKW
jgi:DNA-directed RNA polymerase subunit K/omega